MADFVQTMKDWKRMCNAMGQEDEYTACDKCDLRDFGCPAIYEKECDSADWKHVENVVAKWAAEHSEPVYPTWEEWLQSVGVMESSEGLLRHIKGQLLIDGIPAHAVPTAKVLQPMDADIAEKLGIEPKNG